MIPKSFVQDLLNRVDIVDVIESYVPLKRAGANLTACCPFHSEKTPSFTVSPSKQFYHCFGCGAHGTAIGFLIEYSGLNFVEAVKDLAARTGLKVPETAPNERAPEAGADDAGAERLTEALEQAFKFYKAELRKSELAIDYLKRRGLTGAVAARFGLGYAPPGWQSLAAVLPDYSSRPPVDAGLVIQGEDGKRYDRFRSRIMFPIVSQRGQIIGFGGRVLDQSEPKYLNSPETPLFEKGRELYGLFQARQAIRQAGRVVVVEGYMDVVALAQFGVGYAVATLGTATTPWHVQKLLRQTDEVVFCFDGDSAGRRAAWRALENSLEQLQDGKQVQFLFLPDGHDPDSFVRAQGREAFEKALEQALPLSGFALKELSERVDMSSAEGRAKFLQDAGPLVKRIGAPMLGLMLRKRVAELAGVTQAELEQRFEIGGKRPPQLVPAAASQRAGTNVDSYAKLLERVLVQPALLHDVPPDLPRPRQAGAEAAALLDLVEEARGIPGELSVAGVIELLRGRGHDAVVQRLLRGVDVLQGFSAEELGVEVRACIDNLRQQALRAEVDRAVDVTSPSQLSERDRNLVVAGTRARPGGPN